VITARIAHMAQALLWMLTSLGLVSIPASQDSAPAGPVRLVVLVRGAPAQDRNFERFASAFASRHPKLAERVRLEALRMDDDGAPMTPTLRTLAEHAPALVIAMNGTHALAVRRTAPRLPLVFSTQADPLALGISSSLLKRPEPVTGLWINDELDAKRLELLLDAYPTLRTVGLLGDAEWRQGLGPLQAELQAIAANRRVQLRILQAASVDEALRLVDSADARQVQAWCLPRTTLSLDSRIGRWLLSQGKPVMAGHTPDVHDAANLSYAHDKSFVAPALADLAARVLQGEPAGAIPIQVPQRFQLAVRIVADERLPALSRDIVRRADLVLR